MSKRDEENTAPEIPWEEISYLEGLWRFWHGHTKTPAINGRKVRHVYLVPANEARELLADREKLKELEEAFKILVKMLKAQPTLNESFVDDLIEEALDRAILKEIE